MKALRWTAFIGAMLAAGYEIFAVSEIKPNQHYGFYALALVAGGVAASLLILRPTTRRALKNPDVFVPAGLYLALETLLGVVVVPEWFVGVRGGRFTWIGLSAVFWLVTLARVAAAVVFLGWTTKLLLALQETGAADPLAALEDWRHWLPRAFAVYLFGWLPYALLLALIFLPALFTRMTIAWEPWLYAFMFLLGFGSLLWNAATAALLPAFVGGRGPWRTSFAEAWRLGWANRRKTLVPILLLMIVSGWIVYVSVTYEVPAEKNVEFGTRQRWEGRQTGSRFNFSTNFVWVGAYQSETHWFKQLMKTVEQEPLSSVEFRLALLLLLLAIVVNLRIVEVVRRPSAGAPAAERGSPVFIAGAVACLAVCLLPFEYWPKTWRSDAGGPGAIKPGTVHRGGERIEKRLFVKPEERHLGNVKDVAWNEAEKSLIVSAGNKAVVLDREGALRSQFIFDLPPSGDAKSVPSHFSEVRAVDVDGDGRLEFVGYGAYPYSAFLLDANGRRRWEYKGEGLDIRMVDARDFDGDGRPDLLVAGKDDLKIFDLDGREKGAHELPTAFLTRFYLLDANADGRDEILLLDSLNSVIGEIGAEKFRKIEKPAEILGVLEEKGERPLLLYAAENSLGLFDFEGRLVARLPAPLSEIEDTRFFRNENEYEALRRFVEVYQAKAVKVRLKAGEPKYTAVLLNLRTKLSDIDMAGMLYVYDPQGALVYQETLAGGDGPIIAYPHDDGTEGLLILEENTIWMYRAH